MDVEDIKSLHLVEEIIEEILSRLPVKPLLRFRCVSKSWRALIDSNRFINVHLQNSTKNRALSHHRVIFTLGDLLKQCTLHQLLNERPLQLYPARNNQPAAVGVFLGSQNGLLCHLNGKFFFLWNPATGISMELPVIHHFFTTTPKFGFGWDGKSCAYKVFVLTTDQGISTGNLYSSKTGSWKTIEHGCIHVYEIIGVFARGKLHWLYGDDYIESFDLESEEFGRIELPCRRKARQHFTLAELGGCLHMLIGHGLRKKSDLWVMKDCGWSKLVTLPLVFEIETKRIGPLFVEGPNGEIVIIDNDDLLVYYAKENLCWAAKYSMSFTQGCVYIESLVSPYPHKNITST